MSKLGGLLQRLRSEDWISDAVERSQAPHRTGRFEHWGEPDLHMHPSSAGAACPRDCQLGMLGYHDDMQPKNYRRVRNGTSAHGRWNEDLHGAAILADHDVKYKGPLETPWYSGDFSGVMDVYLQRPVDLTYHIGEIKTMNSHKFRALPPQVPDPLEMGFLLERSMPGYVYQLCAYIAAFTVQWEADLERTDDERRDERGPLPGPPSPIGALIFENTDTQDFAVRYIKPNDKLMERTFEKPRLAREASLEGRLIDPPYRRTSPPCRKCYKESICYKLQDGDEELTALVAGKLEVLSGRA